MQKVIVASNNAHKLREIKAILGDRFEVVSMKEYGIDLEIEETGSTFEENAKIKAKAIFDITNQYVLADDSGLCVDALKGAPGVFSARYAGEHGDDKKNNDKLKQELKNVAEENRTAKFVSAIVLYMGENKILTTKGEVFGRVLETEDGDGGFGYDPLFYSFDLKKSFGMASEQEKNSVSHRKRGLEKMALLLKQNNS